MECMYNVCYCSKFSCHLIGHTTSKRLSGQQKSSAENTTLALNLLNAWRISFSPAVNIRS